MIPEWCAAVSSVTVTVSQLCPSIAPAKPTRVPLPNPCRCGGCTAPVGLQSCPCAPFPVPAGVDPGGRCPRPR